ncbi:MAG: hypothetical protein A2315_07735 [Ignavibacteria bacterium RIFOXYB2_FULL_35_12]|nr:MAG: hypothetical protein A2058_01870 [Ignavibacteria bacterium GWA2_36_19]OGU60400.1 MAG: hypothetical protein A2X60_02945 [Ignavibacteria bacterium GWF2_35_20]OGU83156.1 MAG: hypothetical protein A2254_12635 [Ignavibacteria bacterium RIFOXYA2_FULL_35_9]OGU84297.1 MAG: hypothetical protein A3K31_15475 [Ignavibacteria bacterium RIFOXYA12_FULL_35_25]OGU88554.1 MAG: hypothetical protein A2492_03530 [Ignavibacteria bacterium RIFOXYC12_FULL_35_11]OGU95953.1 MAG: hypothetical protein A2347_10065
MKLKVVIIIIFLFQTVAIPEEHSKTIKKIRDNYLCINAAANYFQVNPLILASIIYTERTLNYDWTDEVFDIALAKLGLNSSIGFCQIKIKTAFFVEVQITDSNRVYFPGFKFCSSIRVSRSVEELINKLAVDSINIFYAAAYLRIIQSYWQRKGFFIDNYPEILGSLYQVGLFYPDGKERKPRWNPQPNHFGLLVKEAVLNF